MYNMMWRPAWQPCS